MVFCFVVCWKGHIANLAFDHSVHSRLPETMTFNIVIVYDVVVFVVNTTIYLTLKTTSSCMDLIPIDICNIYTYMC